MKFNVGDTVEIIYYPGIKVTITHRFVDGLGRNMYKLSDGTNKAEKHLKLLEAYQSKEINNIPMLIILGIILYFMMRQ